MKTKTVTSVWSSLILFSCFCWNNQQDSRESWSGVNASITQVQINWITISMNINTGWYIYMRSWDMRVFKSHNQNHLTMCTNLWLRFLVSEDYMECFHSFLFNSFDFCSINTLLKIDLNWANDLCFISLHYKLKTIKERRKSWHYLEDNVSDEAESSQERVFNRSIQLGELLAVKYRKERRQAKSRNFRTIAEP